MYLQDGGCTCPGDVSKAFGITRTCIMYMPHHEVCVCVC